MADAKKKPQTQTGPTAVRAKFLDARMKAEDESFPLDPDPNIPRNGWKPGGWPGYPADNMPPADTLNRVQVVGRDADGICYVITSTGHLRRVEKWDHATLVDIWAPFTNTLKFCWPAWGKAIEVEDPKTGEVKKIVPVKRAERDPVIEAIMNAAARMPDFDPNQQHRGRGGWRDSHDAFLWHSGGWLWRAEGGKLERSRPAMHDGFLYTRMAATIEPWQMPVKPEESPARRILEHLRTWRWGRPFLDPVLVLGFLGTCLMGGALKARPILFTTGGKGVGKSTLLELLNKALMGAVTTTVNTTAAGIYQRAKYDSLPFLIDELESKAGSTRAEAVIELARVAYTGGDISRGGADHEATTFTARNSFGLFAINAPPMGGQDKSRMAVVNLDRLDAPNGVAGGLAMSPETDGRMLLRQVMDGWADFNGRLMRNWWEALSPHGLDSRAIDTFGTLLAAAELMAGPEALEEAGLPVQSEYGRIGAMVAEATAIERAETLDNWHKCLDMLLQSSIDQWREGIKPTVGSVCDQVLSGSTGQAAGMDITYARERLQLVGLGMMPRSHVDSRGPCLAVPHESPMLNRIFADSEFHKSVWYGALKQAPREIVIRDRGNKQKVKINGSVKHCLLVDLAAFAEATK